MKLLQTAAMASALVLSAAFASAETISVGLQETGVNSGNITTESSSSTPNGGIYSAGFFGLTYGSFDVNNMSAQGTIAPGSLFSNSINTTASGPATLLVYVTQQGVTTPLSSNWMSSFTANQLPSGWTVTETTYYDPNDGLYSTADELATTSLTSNATSISINPAIITGGGPFSLTEVFAITATTSSGSANDTIDLEAVPEPGTLALLGAGLIGLGFIRRRGMSFRV
jgi:hypothetical protein